MGPGHTVEARRRHHLAGRAAGLVGAQPVTVEGPQGIYAGFRGNASSDFTTAVHGSAFWLVRAPSSSTGNLYVSSGARIIQEARADLGLQTGAGTWSPDLFNAAADRAQTLNVSANLPSLARGDLVPVEWMRVLLWVVYSSNMGTGVQVELPLLTELPRLGDSIAGSDATPTQVAVGFDSTRITPDPWARTDGGFRVASGQSTARTGGAAALGLGVLALLLLAGSGGRDTRARGHR